MTFLADENLPLPAVQALRQHGFDLVWVKEGNAGLIDEDVLAWCIRDRRTLLTLDKDFGELVFHSIVNPPRVRPLWRAGRRGGLAPVAPRLNRGSWERPRLAGLLWQLKRRFPGDRESRPLQRPIVRRAGPGRIAGRVAHLLQRLNQQRATP